MLINEKILNNIPCGTLITQNTGNVIYFNDYLLTLFNSESNIIDFSKTQIPELIKLNKDFLQNKIASNTLFIKYNNTDKHFHYSMKKIIENNEEFFIFTFIDISSIKNNITKLNDYFYSAIMNLKNPIIYSLNEIENIVKNCSDDNCIDKNKIKSIRENSKKFIDNIEELKFNYIKNFNCANNHKKTNLKDLLTYITNGMKFLECNKKINCNINFNENDIHEIFVNPDMAKKAFVYLFEYISEEFEFISDDFDINISNIDNKLNIDMLFKINSYNLKKFKSFEIEKIFLNIGGLFNIKLNNNNGQINIKFPIFHEEKTDDKLKMAVVEDDLDILELYKAIFSDNNELNIEYFDSAKVFLDKKRDFELLIVDLYMPEVSGFDLIKNYTKQNKDCKIIIVSGAPPQSITKNTNPQIVDVLAKPIDILYLMNTLKKAINLLR
ncbi:MAG: response regulator [Candidatus Muirbacterium halophilum]|nr:response regulator [Candidatus Muirbacterium halophilum]MCK9475943.1 response regulator [Candidatus Muirbacterium halophilum]